MGRFATTPYCGRYGCTTDEKMPSQGVILLKHKVNSLDNISDYIEGGYNGIEFDLHISDASLLVFYDDLGKANSFIDYINYIKTLGKGGISRQNSRRPFKVYSFKSIQK